MRRRVSLHVGINDYPGSGADLSGCVNDASDWRDFAADHGYTTHTLIDAQATRSRVLNEIARLLLPLTIGDRFLFTYSGHGSWVTDTNGDEGDRRDEVLVMHDWQNAGYLTDDEFYQLYQQRRFGVRVMVFSDSCHSGTVARFAPPSHPPLATPRYFPAPLLNPTLQDLPIGTYPDFPTLRPRSTRPRPETALISGCDDLEYSYDAWIPELNRYNGAFTRAALDTYTPGLNLRQWHRQIRQVLPDSHYDQSPQLNATRWQSTWKI